MTRVLKVMGLLMVLSFMTAIFVQPAFATAMDIPIPVDGESAEQADGTETMETFGGPDESGEGDPDTVGDGYGAQSGDIDGMLSGLFDLDGSDMTFEEFVCYMLSQFLPTP